MTALTARQRAVLVAAMETLVPGDPDDRSTIELGAAERIDELWELLPTRRARADLRRLLALMASRPGGAVLYRRFSAFDRLDDREGALLAMARSPIGEVRLAFQSLKRITAFLVMTGPPGRRAPLWDAMGYPGPDPTPPRPQPELPLHEVTGPTTMTCDVVVVGSGAGGGVAAGVLAGAGLDVVVLDQGRHIPPDAMTHEESTAYRDMYLEHGLAATMNGGVALLAGSVVGGGTTVNWTTSFRTPPQVLAEWDRVSGMPGAFTGDDLQRSTDEVIRRLSIAVDPVQPSPTDEVMAVGLKALGWHVAAQPRNAIACDPVTCGYCGMGCRIGAKQGTVQTYLADAAAAGARIVPRAQVTAVEIDRNRAVGVVADVGGQPVTVSARHVVVAGGALLTPSLLHRSGVRHAVLGRLLRLHPVTVVWGRFAEPIDPWSGTLQSLHSDQFADLDGHGFGYRLETGPAHPALLGILLGWGGGIEYQRRLAEYRHWSPVGILLRDSGAGRARTRGDGSAAWTYALSRRDRHHLRHGIQSAARVLEAAGAERLTASTTTTAGWQRGEPIDAFMDRVDAIGLGANRTAYLSFHQMGTARIGRSADMSVIDANQQVHGVDGLYVMDGSAFPTASGVNPMLSIQALAHRAAERVAERAV